MNNKIKLRTPGYYKNFHCISSECKDNCCVGGWQIDIDEETAEYYSTAFHEMVHSTWHMKRLARLEAPAHFGGEEYSKEELVAEIGAAALMNYTGTETAKAFRNSAAYVQSWLRALRNDKRLIVTASGAASKAVNYILSGAV